MVITRGSSSGRRAVVAWAVAWGLVLASCGSRGGSTASTSTLGAVTTTIAPAATTAPTTTTTAAATTTTTAAVTTTTVTPTTVPDLATTTKLITTNWERFFAAGTPVADREALLEHGATYHEALVQNSTNPLQAQATAKVKKVELAAPDASEAAVTYDVLLKGEPALVDASGKAVLEVGIWKVAGASFCALIALSTTGAIPGCS